MRRASDRGTIIPVVLTVYADRSFDFILKSPPAAVLLKKAAGLEKGSATPNTEKVGKVTRAQVLEIAKRKMDDLNAVRRGPGRPHHHGDGAVDGDRDRGLGSGGGLDRGRLGFCSPLGRRRVRCAASRGSPGEKLVYRFPGPRPVAGE